MESDHSWKISEAHSRRESIGEMAASELQLQQLPDFIKSIKPQAYKGAFPSFSGKKQSLVKTSPLKGRSSFMPAKKKNSLGKPAGASPRRSSVERRDELPPENRSSIHDLLRDQEKMQPAKLEDADKKKGVVLLCDDEEDVRFVESYQPRCDEFLQWASTRTSESFVLKKYKDSAFYGEIQMESSKRHGKGVIIYSSGRVYEGGWSNDRREGHGFEVFANGNSYKGQYINGKVHGQGKYIWKNGEEYDGEWKEGLRHGKGVWRGVAGDEYVGEWHKNQPNGFGKHQWSNGDYYEGQWTKCLRHGQGQDFFQVGDAYIGEYKWGKAEGFGQYQWSNGNIYSGQFFNGMKNGQGTWKKSGDDNANQYKGCYKNDMKHGFGEFTWSTGSRYEGHYKQDQKTNYGEMYWADGSLYKGNWAHGLQEGLGILKFPDGLVTAGFFKENIYTTPLMKMEEYTRFKAANPHFKCTPGFEEEIRKYLEAIKPAEEYEPYINKELVKAEVEDRTRISALPTMQEVPNAPFGPNGISKEDYIKQLQDSNENLFDREPSKVEKTDDTKSLHTKSQLIFHDFDYLNPESNLPFGVDGFSTAQ